MNTPAHLLVGATAFGRPGHRGLTTAAVLGAFAPDASLYVMVAVSIWALGIPADTVFRELYYSDAWQSVFAIDNSFILWGIGLGFAVWKKSPVFIAFTGAALLHLAMDFPLHTHDARQHFWPVTDWVFESPISYWDNRAHAGVVGPFALAMTLGCLAWIWTRFQSTSFKLFAGVLAFAELMSSGVWRFVF